jgi:hypothetical protein
VRINANYSYRDYRHDAADPAQMASLRACEARQGAVPMDRGTTAWAMAVYVGVFASVALVEAVT